MTESTQEHDLYVLTMRQLRARAAAGEDVEQETTEEKKRHHREQARLYRRAHPERVRETAARCEKKRAAARKRYLSQYQKDHPEKQAAATRRYRARRKILAEFMAIDESIFA